MPREIRAVRALGRDRLPKDRMAQRADTELSDAIEIPDAVAVPSLQALVAVIVANTRDSTLDPAPELQGSLHHSAPNYFTKRSKTVLSAFCSMKLTIMTPERPKTPWP